MEVLVTGATGFIGSHLTYFLLQEKNTRVKVLKRKNSALDKIKSTFHYYADNPQKLIDKIQWVDGDVSDETSLYQATKNTDHIYHLAGKVSVNGNGKKEMLLINVGGTINLVQAALKNHVKKICFASSSAVFNKGVSDNYYAKTKLLAEKHIQSSTRQGLDNVIVYPSVVIGPGNGVSGFEKILNSLWHGNVFYTSGGAEFVDVKDVAQAMINLMQSKRKNKRYVLSAGFNTYKNILQIAAEQLKKPKPFVPVGYRSAKVLSYLDKTLALFVNKDPLLTDESLHVLFNKYKVNYGSGNVPGRLDFPYTPVQQSIAEASRYYKAMHHKHEAEQGTTA